MCWLSSIFLSARCKDQSRFEMHQYLMVKTVVFGDALISSVQALISRTSVVQEV